MPYMPGHRNHQIRTSKRLMESIAPGDEVMVRAVVVTTVGGRVVLDIDGESITVDPKTIKPTGGFAAYRRLGRQARADGKSISECPYEKEVFRQQWIKGWMEG